MKKIPLLGSLPILGWLFRDTTTTKTKTNLLLFLTPYIIRDQADYRRIYEKKRKEQQEFVEQFYGRRPATTSAIDFTRKAGLYSRLHRDVQDETDPPGERRPGQRRASGCRPRGGRAARRRGRGPRPGARARRRAAAPPPGRRARPRRPAPRSSRPTPLRLPRRRTRPAPARRPRRRPAPPAEGAR